MEVVFIFLKWVASFAHIDEETGSKMDLNNLAIVMGPNILYSKSKDPSKDDSFAGIRTIQDLLENQDRFWQVGYRSMYDDCSSAEQIHRYLLSSAVFCRTRNG